MQTGEQIRASRKLAPIIKQVEPFQPIAVHKPQIVPEVSIPKAAELIAAFFGAVQIRLGRGAVSALPDPQLFAALDASEMNSVAHPGSISYAGR